MTLARAIKTRKLLKRRAWAFWLRVVKAPRPHAKIRMFVYVGGALDGKYCGLEIPDMIANDWQVKS